MSSIRSIKGMNDALFGEAAAFHRVEQAAREVFGRYGFGELRTPIVEEAALFQRGIGDATDVVEKEMYLFPDRHDTLLALRPEGTASAVRAYLQHNPAADDPVTRWFYVGPMFRHERPQKGRYRQFQQVEGAELFGAANPEADAEMIAMIHDWLAALGLKGVELQLNSIGDSVCRPGYLETLRVFLRAHAAELCEDCRRRTETNSLRTLDCKQNPDCQRMLTRRPPRSIRCASRARPTSPRCAAFSASSPSSIASIPGWCGGSTTTRVPPSSSRPRRASGHRTPWRRAAATMDWWRRWAVSPPRRWVSRPGSSGWFWRWEEDKVPAAGPDLFVASHSEGERASALKLASTARAAHLWAEIDPRGGSLKSQLRRADRLGAKMLVVLGNDEVQSGRAKIKQMGIAGSLGAGQSQEINLAEVVREVQRVLGVTKGGG